MLALVSFQRSANYALRNSHPIHVSLNEPYLNNSEHRQIRVGAESSSVGCFNSIDKLPMLLSKAADVSAISDVTRLNVTSYDFEID